jgi:hypothetical protein
MDRDTEAVIAAAGRWHTARREREVAAVVAWSQRRRQCVEARLIEAMVAAHHEATGCTPAWAAGSRFAAVRSSARSRATAGTVVRCACGGPEPCECAVIGEELARAEAAGQSAVEGAAQVMHSVTPAYRARGGVR